jgi:hypothetical protein
MHKLQFLGASGALALVLLPPVATPRPSSPARSTIPFDAVSMTIELNSTDADAGVILFSDTESRLRHLTIQDPSGNVVYEMTSSDAVGLGLTEMQNETAEPDIQTAFDAYPEGDYTFTGEAFDGTILSSVAHLSHTMPAAPVVSRPEDGAVLSLHDIRVRWALDPAIDHYWIEIEQEDPPVNFTMQLQPGVHDFEIPSQLLRRGASYVAGVGAVAVGGNTTVSEVEFETR